MTPFEQIKQDFQDKKVLIFGLGLQGRGVGTAKFFAQIGSQVTVTDLKSKSDLTQSIKELAEIPITYSLGSHQESDVIDADIVIRNASVPWNHPLLNLARELHKPIKMDAALFFEYTLTPNTIGITGTRGKSTTTNLIYKILKAAGKKAILAGNTTATASVNLIADYHPDTFYVFELSSWQLQAFHQQKLSPHLAVVTNLFPDHLIDRSYREYQHDKTAIFAYQTPGDTLFINHDDQTLVDLAKQAPSTTIYFSTQDFTKPPSTHLKGNHNLQNIAAASAVAKHLHLDPKIIKTVIANFKPLRFRLQPIPNQNNPSIINDSTSTTPVAAIKALNTYPDSILILGGTSKKLPTSDLVDSLNRQAKAIILLSGTGTEEIKPHLNSDLIKLETKSLEAAVTKSLKLATNNDTILFSPGFTSFGLFTNEFDRGEQFNSLVKTSSRTSR